MLKNKFTKINPKAPIYSTGSIFPGKCFSSLSQCNSHSQQTYSEFGANMNLRAVLLIKANETIQIDQILQPSKQADTNIRPTPISVGILIWSKNKWFYF